MVADMPLIWLQQAIDTDAISAGFDRLEQFMLELEQSTSVEVCFKNGVLDSVAVSLADSGDAPKPRGTLAGSGVDVVDD